MSAKGWARGAGRGAACANREIFLRGRVFCSREPVRFVFLYGILHYISRLLFPAHGAHGAYGWRKAVALLLHAKNTGYEERQFITWISEAEHIPSLLSLPS